MEPEQEAAKPLTPTPELAQEANEEDSTDSTATTTAPHHHHIELPPADKSLHLPKGKQKSSSSPATTPEPSSMSSGTSLFTSWYSLSSAAEQESKTYRNYVQNIDKCLKQFEYSTEWPDLIAALTRLNKVISTYNSTLSSAPAPAANTNSSNSTIAPAAPPPLPRTHLITKRLAQCLHPNLPSGVHLKTLETFELIFQGFRYNEYVNLEQDLFSFVSGLLPLWSYAAISVKPKLLSLYESHLVPLGERLRPALDGIMLSLFSGLVDDGVEQDIKIRSAALLQQLEQAHPDHYATCINNLVQAHPCIHLPLITHIVQTNYLPPPTILLHLVTSPNTLVQRNAMELLNQRYDVGALPQPLQIRITSSAIQTLLKRDPSITRRVFTFIEGNQDLLVLSIESLIHDCVEGQSFTRILSQILDNPNVDILERVLASVVRYLMKCEYNTSVSFLSTLNSGMLSSFFLTYLFSHSSLDDLESRVIVFNYVVKMRLFEIDYELLFSRLSSLDDLHIKVILQMVRLHYTTHTDSFVRFCNEYLAQYFSLRHYDHLRLNTQDVIVGSNNSSSSSTTITPPTFQADFTSHSIEFVLELLQKSNPDEDAFKYVVIGACTESPYTRACLLAYIHFQNRLLPELNHTHALALIFKATYRLDQRLLNVLKYPEKYLLSEMQTDDQIRNVIQLDLSSSPLVVLKLVDPVAMGTPYRRFLCEQFIGSHSTLVLQSVLKYLEFSVDRQVVVRAKSEGDLSEEDGASKEFNSEFKHAQSVMGVDKGEPCSPVPTMIEQESCAYDSARVNTLVEKLEFVVSVNREFLVNVDLVVLLSKLVLLATISNHQEQDQGVTLSIQTRSLRLIEKVVALHGESTHSFVYDSILTYLSNVQTNEYSLLWELAGVNVLRQFFPLDIENYTLALVVQKRLQARSTDPKLNELCESVHLRWLTAIASNLTSLRKHFNALVLITYTSVCKNLMEHEYTDLYVRESVKFLSTLLRHVLESRSTHNASTPVHGGSSSTGGGGFLSSFFGSTSTKENLVDEHEALRIALLGKLDLLLRIACKKRVRGSPLQLLDLLKHLYENHEASMLQCVNKCLDVTNLDMVLKDLKVPASKLLCCDAIAENTPFLTKYLHHERTLDVQGIVGLCKGLTSCGNMLTLVTEYLRACGGKPSKELQDLVVRAIDLGVEKREFPVLEVFVPGIFDLVWGDTSDENSSCGGGGGGASNANARDQKVIVNVVHGVVVAVLVAIKAGSTAAGDGSGSSSSLISALRVLEQISHHSYLRKSWKKEVFDLITNEPTFFYFTPECLGYWKVIVDNLFTQDRSTFSELITRLTQTTQMSTSALNIFSSKESEVLETRASLLKRLAFVLHSSERDQYAKYITNIQEKIAEALKIGSTNTSNTGVNSWNSLNPSIAAIPATVNKSIFLCFRVMVNKFNCNVLVSLWPIVVHEVVMVLSSLQQLLEDHCSSNQSCTPPPVPHLQMYLQTLKLLNFLFTLPSSEAYIPHFHMYKWAFTSTTELESSNNNNAAFVPYMERLKVTAQALYSDISFTTPPLRIKRVSTLEELCTGFGCLDQPVPEAEWELLDFCDGYSDSPSPDNTDL